MTQIDFYLLPRDGSLGMISAVGRIADKATAKGHQIFVQVKDETEGVEFQKDCGLSGLRLFSPLDSGAEQRRDSYHWLGGAGSGS